MHRLRHELKVFIKISDARVVYPKITFSSQRETFKCSNSHWIVNLGIKNSWDWFLLSISFQNKNLAFHFACPFLMSRWWITFSLLHRNSIKRDTDSKLRFNLFLRGQRIEVEQFFWSFDTNGIGSFSRCCLLLLPLLDGETCFRRLPSFLLLFFLFSSCFLLVFSSFILLFVPLLQSIQSRCVVYVSTFTVLQLRRQNKTSCHRTTTRFVYQVSCFVTQLLWYTFVIFTFFWHQYEIERTADGHEFLWLTRVN
jgi:hypothetical protein